MVRGGGGTKSAGGGSFCGLRDSGRNAKRYRAEVLSGVATAWVLGRSSSLLVRRMAAGLIAVVND